MKVKRRFGTLDELPPEVLEGLVDVDSLRRVGASAIFFDSDREMVVLGLEFWRGNLFYRLANPPDERYAVLGLAAFFAITDGRPSRYWRCQMGVDGRFTMCHKEWFSPWYHDKLSDGDADALKVFLDVKTQLKEES